MKVLVRVTMIVALAAFLPPAGRPASAANDAGTQSPFAFGAAPRAIGMGSAFVAATDDASAIVWNPAGLSAATRIVLEAAQSSDLGLGRRDVSAIVALPSWRWGTAAMSVRSFGVDGIDGRDERNQPLGEFSDRQMEIALGYGRAMTRGLRLGGTVKLERQSMAGLSANGLGLDLGLQLEPGSLREGLPAWVSGWTVGLAARNVVRPTLRLDRDAVSDPTAVRGGLAWRGTTAGWGGLIVEVDVDKADGVPVRSQMGIEYRPLGGFALRVGHDAGALAAGSSFQWRDCELHYAFLDNPIAAEHRLGVSVAFGPSTAVRRLADQRRQDEALEVRLATAFAERQGEQIASLVTRAQAARARGDLDEAIDGLEAAQILEPGRPEVAALIAGCLVDRARALELAGDWGTAALTYERALARAPADSVARDGAARCRTESDRRAARSTRARERFRAGMDAFVRDELIAAREEFSAVGREMPGDAEAETMLRRTELAISRQCAQALDGARRALRAGMIVEAQALLDRAARLDANAPGLAALRAAVAAASTPARTAPAKAPETSGSRLDDREIERLYRQGVAASERRQVDDALRYWELVWSNRPGYREVNDLLKREYLTRGIEAFAAGRLEEALVHWQKALRIDPDDERTRGYLARAQQQIARGREIMEDRR